MKYLLPAAAFLLAAPAMAQISAGITGTVHDASGAVIVNAQVTLTETATLSREQAPSSSAGTFQFTDLNPGIYMLNVKAPGFTELTRSSVTAIVGDTVRADLVLTPSTAEQTIQIIDDLTTPLLQADQSDIETHMPGSEVIGLPLNSRNFISLAQLAPGVELPPGTLLPRINGGRPRTNEYLYDGISALLPEPGQVAFFPILDDIAEFTVESNNLPAEFGRFNGGVVNVATRAGTNALHGSLFEFFRNEDLNAMNYFAAPATRKPEYRRNLYGATLGGPLLRDRLFGFADYQGIKQLIGRTVFSTVPTLAQRQGNFGTINIYDPFKTSQPPPGGKYIRPQFPNNVINEPLDPSAVALLNLLPLPLTTGTANNYSRTANDADHQNQFDVRLDGAHADRDRAFGRYTYYSEVEQPISSFPGKLGPALTGILGTGNVSGLSNVLGQQAVFAETHVFSPALLNDVHLGYTRRSNSIGGPTLGDTASAALGIPGIPSNAAFNNAFPLISFTGYTNLGPTASTFSQYQTGVWQLEDTINFLNGRHAIKAGADVRWYQLNAISPPNPTGSFAFTTTGTDTQSASSTATSGGNAFASFLLGQVDTFSIDLQASKLRPRDHIQEYFAQDDWRATDKLTINAGLRWTLASPSTEKNNQGAIFNTGTQLLEYAGANGNSRSARRLHFGELGPRLGLTYLVTPKTVIRAGFGMVFFDQSGITTPFTLPQFPFIQNVQQKTQDSINAAFLLSQGPTVAPIPLTPDAGLGQSVYTSNRAAGSGYVEQWNLAFQRKVTQSLFFDIACVGQHVVHVGVPDSNFNQLTAAQLAQGLTNPASLTGSVTNPYAGQVPGALGAKMVAAAQLLKPYPRFQNVAVYRNNNGTANYNAIEAKVEERPAHGLYLLFAYTHSKLIDDASSVFSSTVLSSPNTSSLIAADTYRPYLERDSSSGDMPNVTTAGVTYQLPAGHGYKHFASGVSGAVLGGWALNGIVTAQSGMPVTVTQATNTNAFAGVALQRPNLIGQPALAAELRTPQRFFNTAAFATSPTFTFGNASRNPVRGPAYRDLDLALVKHTPVVEHVDLEFRAELFNVMNTPAFAQPNGSFGAAAFGSITATSAEQRVAQFALKLSR